MPLNKYTVRTFHRTLYAGQLESITLLKRDDDQKQGTVRAILVHQVRRSMIFKTGEPIQGDMSANHRAKWHFPRIELDRVGVGHIGALDRIVDDKGRYWQPEADTMLIVKLFETHICIDCKRVDPPVPSS